MSGIANKLKQWVDWVGFNQNQEAEEGDFLDGLFRYDEQYEEEEEMQEPVRRKKQKPNLNVVPHPAGNVFEVVVTEPRTFEESLEAVNSLRDRKTIVLNLHLLDAEQSQRVVDFIAGATHALDGNQQRIGEGVFIFTPNNVNISSETEKARALKDAYWAQA
ncbi:MAG: cell division protein SepF [Candidatus Gastranaerophilales bacterium]|nr:cell division protein SepF [Candidatus Gastranaerophilales bacterium]